MSTGVERIGIPRVEGKGEYLILKAAVGGFQDLRFAVGPGEVDLLNRRFGLASEAETGAEVVPCLASIGTVLYTTVLSGQEDVVRIARWTATAWPPVGQGEFLPRLGSIGTAIDGERRTRECTSAVVSMKVRSGSPGSE